MSGFVSYNAKEDMQDDTYKIITQLIIECVIADRNKDVEAFYNNLKTTYLLIWKRLPKDDSDKIGKSLRLLRDQLYSIDIQENNSGSRSLIFDTCEEVFKKITGVLDDQGILFRMRSDLDTLVTQ